MGSGVVGWCAVRLGGEGETDGWVEGWMEGWVEGGREGGREGRDLSRGKKDAI